MKFYTAGQVAQMVGVTKRTVDKWRAEGKFVPEVRTPGGHSRYTEKQVNELLKPEIAAEVDSQSIDDLMG